VGAGAGPRRGTGENPPLDERRLLVPGRDPLQQHASARGRRPLLPSGLRAPGGMGEDRLPRREQPRGEELVEVLTRDSLGQGDETGVVTLPPA
jgi:hypothetical protein